MRSIDRTLGEFWDLQLGHWIEGISAALVKLKSWEEASHWLELFFGLEAQYQDRLDKSRRPKMLKRLERCKANLANKV